jgi:hypothetical protein
MEIDPEAATSRLDKLSGWIQFILIGEGGAIFGLDNGVHLPLYGRWFAGGPA